MSRTWLGLVCLALLAEPRAALARDEAPAPEEQRAREAMPHANPEPATATRPLSKPEADARRKLWTGIGLAAGGLLVLGGAVGCTVAANSAGDQLHNLETTGNAWGAQYRSISDDASRNQIAAAVLWVVGDLALVAGSVTAIVGAQKQRALRLGIAVSPGGAFATLSVPLGGKSL
jgi:hypothetical protein